MDNNTKEVLINIVNWYDSVNVAGKTTIDDLANLNSIAESARNILDKQQTSLSAGELEQYWLDFAREIDVMEPSLKHENDD